MASMQLLPGSHRFDGLVGHFAIGTCCRRRILRRRGTGRLTMPTRTACWHAASCWWLLPGLDCARRDAWRQVLP